MRNVLHDRLIDGRIREGRLGSDESFGLTGAFFVQGPCGEQLKIIASDATGDDLCEGWEHVSVSTRRRCPNWQEMSFVKKLFWRDDETVVQFHPPESDYVNNHPHCLHLWKDTRNGHKMPPAILVGVKALGTLEEAGA